jgi:hypothetical protein
MGIKLSHPQFLHLSFCIEHFSGDGKDPDSANCNGITPPKFDAAPVQRPL